jgi:hypothetical protein
LEEKGNLITTAARTSIYLGIIKTYDEAEEQVQAAIRLEDVAKRVTVILENPNSEITYNAINLLIADLDSEYGPMIASALVVFNTYYKTPNVSELISEEYRAYILALFKGVNDGSLDVLKLHKVVVD